MKNLDLTQVPLTALKKSTMVTLSASLNQSKVIPTKNGLPRDWRGLAQLMGLDGVEANQISMKQDRVSALVDHWGARGNVHLLQEYLGCIDRYDVLDDTNEAIIKDSLDYVERLNKVNISCVASNRISIEADKRILTIDDVIRLEKGLEPQIYDAYVLYAEEDANFATEVVETMEKKYNFKLCVRDRDLIGGVQFEHDAITKLIAERCRRLVVIVSSNFLKSKANKFFVTFAQALGIDIRERKVIPILYERCEVPPELSYYFLLDYNRAGKLWSFWDKLRDSIQAPGEASRPPPPPPPSSSSSSSHLVSGCEVACKAKSDIWISRTHFDEPESSNRAARNATGRGDEAEAVRAPPVKKTNLYKILKSGFSRVTKGGGAGSSGQKKRESSKLHCGASLLDLTNLVAGDGVPFDNLDNSSSFETRSEGEAPGNGTEESNNENAKTKTKTKKKKKWYKKEAVESLLS